MIVTSTVMEAQNANSIGEVLLWGRIAKLHIMFSKHGLWILILSSEKNISLKVTLVFS